jgi:2-dehydro-3-deoxyphosphogluconate aldolase / (4S)-4-hydroxy-2-oxoglutarate aldolase
MTSITEIAPVIPVVTIDNAKNAVPIARALLDGGVGIIELTLRTPTALDSLARIARQVPDIVVGAGTVLDAPTVERAVAAGAQFLVSPGTTPTLLAAMERSGLPFLPGAATVSEAMILLERGVTTLKFFPAAAAGGAALLSAIAGPLPQLRFCPTGGITPQSAPEYLALGNVDCVGGSWFTPADAVAAGDWSRISALAAQSLALRS